MSRNTPPCGDPRPALTSALIDRATSSRGSSSGGRRLLAWSVYQRSASSSVSAYIGAEHVGHVVEHEPLALGVAQHPAVAAHRLGDQQAGHRQRPDHMRRVELHELHVQQGRPGQQGERVPVPGVLPGVGRDLERLPDAAGGEHHRRRLEQDESSRITEISERPGDAPPVASTAVLHQPDDRGLGVDLDHRLRVAEVDRVFLLQRDDLLLQGADHLQAGPVADVGQPRVLVPAEVPLADLAVLGPVEQRAPRLELPEPGPGPPWRAVRPSASCSGTCRRASCRGSGPASCRSGSRCPWRPRSRPRP